VRPLLFERLAGAGPGSDSGRPSSPAETRAQVEASVAREVGALLNTRIDLVDPAERTVLDYGIPDYSGMSSASGTDRQTIARFAERAIRAFEPRLANPKVTVVEENVGSRTLEFRIVGVLSVNKVAAMQSFTLSMSPDANANGG